MRVVSGRRGPQRAPERAVVAVGVFDGVHVAHQHLIRRTVSLAKRIKGTSVVLTFHPDPQHVMDPRCASPSLMPLETRLGCFRSLGVDLTWVVPFDKSFARTKAEEFIRRFLIRRLRATILVVGEKFVFGSRRIGNLGTLKRFGSQLGMRVVPVHQIVRGGSSISSSRIRHLVKHAQLKSARDLLGYYPTIYGKIVAGLGRGAGFGIPTANIHLRSQIMPPHGVYAVLVSIRDKDRAIYGVMNLGVRPSFGSGPCVCEVHLLDFSGTLKGRLVSVSLLRRLRSERCFKTSNALVNQIRRDIKRARRIFACLGSAYQNSPRAL